VEGDGNNKDKQRIVILGAAGFIGYHLARYFHENCDLNIVLIFDEMSGINSFETKYPYGDEFQKTFDDFNKKYNFTAFVNSYSLSDNTASSISNLLNSKNKKTRDESSIASIRKKSLK
jgi:N-acetyl-gamma-glutamylphosphate reductase